MRIGLRPNDVNLQTEELHCNYTVLIGSLEQMESSLLCYPTIINFLGELLGEINYIIVRFLEYDTDLDSQKEGRQLIYQTKHYPKCHDLAKQLSQYLYFFSFPLDYY